MPSPSPTKCAPSEELQETAEQTEPCVATKLGGTVDNGCTRFDANKYLRTEGVTDEGVRDKSKAVRARVEVGTMRNKALDKRLQKAEQDAVIVKRGARAPRRPPRLAAAPLPGLPVLPTRGKVKFEEQHPGVPSSYHGFQLIACMFMDGKGGGQPWGVVKWPEQKCEMSANYRTKKAFWKQIWGTVTTCAEGLPFVQDETEKDTKMRAAAMIDKLVWALEPPVKSFQQLFKLHMEPNTPNQATDASYARIPGFGLWIPSGPRSSSKSRGQGKRQRIGFSLPVL